MDDFLDITSFSENLVMLDGYLVFGQYGLGIMGVGGSFINIPVVTEWCWQQVYLHFIESLIIDLGIVIFQRTHSYYSSPLMCPLLLRSSSQCTRDIIFGSQGIPLSSIGMV